MERIERIEVPTSGKVESILAAATRTFLANGFGYPWEWSNLANACVQIR